MLTTALSILVAVAPGGHQALPCRASDFRTRVHGRVQRESYGPYKAGPISLVDGFLYNHAKHATAFVRVFCDD